MSLKKIRWLCIDMYKYYLSLQYIHKTTNNDSDSKSTKQQTTIQTVKVQRNKQRFRQLKYKATNNDSDS